MSESYFDYLVECVLMIGPNEYSNLMISPYCKVVSDDITKISFQQQILAALSSQIAMFPFSITKHQYPQVEFMNSTSKSHEEVKTTSKISDKSKKKKRLSNDDFMSMKEIVDTYNVAKYNNVQLRGVKTNVKRMQSRRKSLKKLNLDTYSGRMGSVSMETIKNFPTTYFNNNLHLSSSLKSPFFEILPLTDNLGNRSYATRLEFYKKYEYEYRIINDKPDYIIRRQIEEKNSNIIYVPFNVVIFSNFPYFNLFKDILSDFYKQILTKDINDIELELIEYSSIITRVPLINTSQLSINFKIYEQNYTIIQPNKVFKVNIDWDMRILFNVLSIDNIVFILLALLQEQNLVFLSNSTNLTTIVCETLTLLLRPFVWKFFYLTVLPNHLFDLLGAVFPFIIGIPRYLKQRVLDGYDNVIVVDLEDGSITEGKSSLKVHKVSSVLIQNLKEEFTMINHFRFDHLSSLNIDTDNDNNNLNASSEFNTSILTIFMNFFVDLYSEILSHIYVENIGDNKLSINMDKFLKTGQNIENLEFFRNISNTDNFLCFIDNIFNKKIKDNFIEQCNERHPLVLKFMKDSIVSNWDESNSKKVEIDSIQLPTDQNTRRCYFESLWNEIVKIEDNLTRLLFTAEYNLQRNEKVEALEQFYKILCIDYGIINISKIRKLIRGLDMNDADKLVEKLFYNELCLKVEYSRDTIKGDMQHQVKPFVIPSENINQEDFNEVCQQATIATFDGNIINLFNCFVLDFKSKAYKFVKKERFYCFYQNWINDSNTYGDLKFDVLPNEELIRMTHNQIRIDGLGSGQGSGRIVLSQFRLYFVPFGQLKAQIIVDFTKHNLVKLKTDVRLIKALTHFPEVLELATTFEGNNKKYTFWIKDEVDIWHKLIKELSTANRISRIEKDYSLIEQATELCFIYENLVACSKHDDYFKKYLNEFSKKLMIFSNYIHDFGDNNTHQKYIMKKLMPSYKLCVSINSVIEVEIPGSNNIYLWCGCSIEQSHFIRIFELVNEETCNLQNQIIEFNSKIVKMVYMKNSSKVGIICGDNIFYIYDSISQKVESKVELSFETQAMVTCCLVTIDSNQQSTAYFGSTHGDISFWKFNKVQTYKWITIPYDLFVSIIEEHSDKATLIVGGLYYFHIVKKLDGQILKSIKVSNICQPINRFSSMMYLATSNMLIISKARMPVVIFYDLSDITNPNLVTTMDMNSKSEFVEPIEKLEILPTSVGITTVLNVPVDNNMYLWIFYKNGTVEIINSLNFCRMESFIAHKGVIEGAFVTKLRNQYIVVSVGRDDTKINLWKTKPY